MDPKKCELSIFLFEALTFPLPTICFWVSNDELDINVVEISNLNVVSHAPDNTCFIEHCLIAHSQ